MTKSDKIITQALIITGLIFIITIVRADSYHTIERTVIEQTIINYDNDRNTAKATAAGQHHYKTHSQLQWSVGAGFSGDESALSFGLGLQAGKIFFSGNITDSIFSGDSDPIVGLGASGTF